MIKISRMADYAVVVLATLLKGSGQPMSAAAVAEASRLPEPTVAKVLKMLASDGVIVSTRGAGGGYALEKSAQEISIAQILASVDGPVALTSCVEGHESTCSYSGACPAHGKWNGVNLAIKNALESVSLAEMLGTNRMAA